MYNLPSFLYSRLDEPMLDNGEHELEKLIFLVHNLTKYILTCNVNFETIKNQ